MVNIKSWCRKEKSKPKAVADYNSNMNGVDLSDRLMVHFLTTKDRLKKYYKKVFRHMLDMTLLNSYITYKSLGGKVTQHEFILALSEKLISRYVPERPTATCRPSQLSEKPLQLVGRHFAEYCPTKEKNARSLRVCALGQNNKIRKESSY